MYHDVFVGPTGCGKSALAKSRARAYLAAGVKVLVCDPLHDLWPCTWQTESAEQLIEVAKQSRRCALFIDEGGESLKRDAAFNWLFCTARHWGHKTHALVQTGVQMNTTMRGQCGTVCLFSSLPHTAELWADAFREPGLMLAGDESFPRFHFLQKERWKPLRHLVVSDVQ